MDGLVPLAKLSNADRTRNSASPPALTPLQSVAVELAAGQHADFLFQPTVSRKYSIATKGACNTLLALFEEINGNPRYLTAADDSGEDRNASIAYKLFKGRKYLLLVRVYQPAQSGTTSLMVSRRCSRRPAGHKCRSHPRKVAARMRRAFSQSRRTVRRPTPSASAISASTRPPK